MEEKQKKRWKFWRFALLAAVLLTAAGAVYGYCGYKGYILLNHPSRLRYPVRRSGCVPLPGGYRLERF